MDLKRYNVARSAVINHLATNGYSVDKNLIYLCLQGSQNYNMDVYSDEYESDFDWKAFVLPSFKDLYYNTKVSKTYHYEYGQVEVKDIRLFPELLAKMNSSYLELLYSDYCIGKGWVSFLRSAADTLVADRICLLMQTLMGTACQKQMALCHVTKGKEEVFDKFGGYDPKNLHHAGRVLCMMKDLADGVDHFGNVLWFDSSSDERMKLIDTKIKGVSSKEEAVKEMDEIINKCREYYNKFWNADGSPMYPIKSDTLHSMEQYIYELVEDCVVNK